MTEDLDVKEMEVAESIEQDETEEAAESATAEQSQTSETEKVEQPPRKGGVQGRIDELTRKRRLAEAEAEFWKKKALSESSEKETVPPVKPKTEPKPGEYATVEEYLTAVRAYDREQLRVEMRSEVEKVSRQQAERSEASELQSEWSEHESEVSQAHDDYQDVTQTALDALAEAKGPAQAALAHAIQYSGAGPELLYHLGQNPELIEELAEMHPTRAVVALGRLEGSLAMESGEKAAPHTKAPKPPTPVRSGKASDPSELSDSLDPETWRKRFMKRLDKAN